MSNFQILDNYDSEKNFFDRQERINWWNQDSLKNAKVMVVGAGAIGNEVLKNLALLGIGNIFIVDFDTISSSNLSRTVLFRKDDVGKKKAEVAAKRVKELVLFDNTRIDWFHGDLVWELGTGIYREMDIVLGCIDNIETRIAINKNCWLTNTAWIDAGMKELGLRVEFYNPPELPCYQCTLTDEQMQNATVRYSCDFFKKKVFDQDKIPTTQIASAIVGAIQVQEAVKYLCKQVTLAGKKIYYQGINNEFDVFSKPPNKNCFAHVHYDEIIQLPIASSITLRKFLQIISRRVHSGKDASLDFRGDRTFIKSICCRNCLTVIEVMRPTFMIEESQTICKKCNDKVTTIMQIEGQSVTTKQTQEVFNFGNCTEELLEMSLSQIGVPYNHVVAVMGVDGKYKYYELVKDKSKILNQITKPKK